MIRIRSNLDLERLAKACFCLENITDGTGILMANGQFKPMPFSWDVLLRDAVAECERILARKAKFVMVNTLLPGGSSKWHVDPDSLGRFERWHLPIVTNPKCFFEADNGPIHMAQGEWCGPVVYWEPHRVDNYGDEARVHLIVDLDSK